MLHEETRAARRRKDSVFGRRVSGDKAFMANQFFAGWQQPDYSYGTAVPVARYQAGMAKSLGWRMRNSLIRLLQVEPGLAGVQPGIEAQPPWQRLCARATHTEQVPQSLARLCLPAMLLALPQGRWGTWRHSLKEMTAQRADCQTGRPWKHGI